MRIITLIICIVFYSNLTINAQNKKELYERTKIIMTEPQESIELLFSDDKVDINFDPQYRNDGYYFVGVTVKNKMDNRIFMVLQDLV